MNLQMLFAGKHKHLEINTTCSVCCSIYVYAVNFCIHLKFHKAIRGLRKIFFLNTNENPIKCYIQMSFSNIAHKMIYSVK